MSSTPPPPPPPKKSPVVQILVLEKSYKNKLLFKKERLHVSVTQFMSVNKTDTMYENLLIMGYSLRFLKSLHQSFMQEKLR